MTSSFKLSRRAFGAGTAGLALAGLLPKAAFAAETRSVTSVLGTYDIPADPLRVIAIDSRLDLEPALALGLNVIGHAYWKPEPWVPVPDGLVFVGETPDLEQVLKLDPDLIICTDVGDHNSEYWPIARLKDIAPVLPPDYAQPWKTITAELGAWTGREGQADAIIAEYDALIADIKSRRADLIATKKIAVVQPWSDGTVYLQSRMSLLQPQIMADLGANWPEPVEGNIIAAENFGTYFGDVDAILYVNHGEGVVEQFAADPIWNRVPAIAAGKTLAPLGNTNFGGVYTAMQIAKFLDELYGTLA